MTSYGYLITKMADSENVRSSINNDLVTEKSEDSSAKERRPIQQAALKGRQQIQDRAEKKYYVPPRRCQELVTIVIIIIIVVLHNMLSVCHACTMWMLC